MRTFGSFVWALVLSLVAAQLVAHQLAVYFRTREEFIAVMVLLFLFAFVSIAVFAIVFAASDTVVALDRTALSLAGVVILAILGIVMATMASNDWKPPSTNDLQIEAEILFPALIAIAVQWWMVRRRKIKVMA